MNDTAAYGVSLFWWIVLVAGTALPLALVFWVSRTAPRRGNPHRMRGQHQWNDLIEQHNQGLITTEEFQERKKEIEERRDVA